MNKLPQPMRNTKKTKDDISFFITATWAEMSTSVENT